ncbi:DUF4224 domain-containing protein [Pectobacterium parmentieri]|nr:DUF4224 domain-containing protein [Pectobacterium parmentieri]MBI0494811.1 DUF4224 domain-containing protein [Pectobacterium parmentieri]MBI0556152.1 DUF4224 domain-containing protein [Pectobacterium parmentieri]MBI0569226.1 DUF4224 domain-containing protein [Pectobacterium parmentieri]MBI0574063.1 DUF4224 domain-containing protein [Pectobacterium parmentieri]
MTLITDEEIIEITGSRYPSIQCKILQEYGVPFVRRRDGRPRTTWYNFNHPLSTRNKQLEPEPRWEPDFSCFDEPPSRTKSVQKKPIRIEKPIPTHDCHALKSH